MSVICQMGIVLTPELLQALSIGRIEFESNKKRGVSVVGDQQQNVFLFRVVFGKHLFQFLHRGRIIEHAKKLPLCFIVRFIGEPVGYNHAGISGKKPPFVIACETTEP